VSGRVKCHDCGRRGDDTCPLCGLSFCRLCAEAEGESCCDKKADIDAAAKPAPSRGAKWRKNPACTFCDLGGCYMGTESLCPCGNPDRGEQGAP
jgi:hypothetical protein